jgi:ParB family chromosome partitioning protein
MLELALIENIQRQELNAIEEAYAYKRLIETFNLTQETVAQRVGRDRTFVTNYLRLLRLPEDIQLLVRKISCRWGHARALLGIDDADKQREIARGHYRAKFICRDTERTVKRVVAGRKLQSGPPPYPPREEATRIHAPPNRNCVAVGDSGSYSAESIGRGGKIEVQYYNEADLQRVYEC